MQQLTRHYYLFRVMVVLFAGNLLSSSFCPDVLSITSSSFSALSLDSRSENSIDRSRTQGQSKNQEFPLKGIAKSSPHTMLIVSTFYIHPSPMYSQFDIVVQFIEKVRQYSVKNKSIHIFIVGTLLKLPSNWWPRNIAYSSAAGQTEQQATGLTLDRHGILHLDFLFALPNSNGPRRSVQ